MMLQINIEIFYMEHFNVDFKSRIIKPLDTIFNISMKLILMLEMFYLNSTLNFGITPVLVFQLEVYYNVDRLLTGLTAQQKGTTARWYSNKTSLHKFIH